MRASPYDVSGVPGCEGPIAVETAEGRRRYAEEQEQLAIAAAPLRRQLLAAYETALQGLETLTRSEGSP